MQYSDLRHNAQFVVKPRWWLTSYLFLVFFLANLFDRAIDEEKFTYWFRRGWSIKYRWGGRWVRIQ